MKKHKIFLHTILLFCIVLLFSFLIPSFTKIIQHKIEIAQATRAIEAPLTLEEEKANEIASRSKYDARDDGIVPAVRNQGNWLLCWAYSSIAAAEINILKHGYVKDPSKMNFSPQNLSNNLENRQDDPLHNTYEDVYNGSNFNKGGWPTATGEVLTQWRGLTKSSNYLGYEQNEYILKEHHTNMSTDTANIKKAIATYGSVTFTYTLDNANIIYYHDIGAGEPHASVIIGWDDSIPATNFYPNATQNGAWIVRNSWGETAHKNGYFYLSYDSKISDITAFDYTTSSAYDHNYFYDANCAPYAWLNRFSTSQAYMQMANIFEVKKRTATTEELLKAVNIGVAGYNFEAEIQIYTGLASLYADPDSGTLVATKKVRIPEYGFYTIDLDTPVSLDDSQYFSVVVKLSEGAAFYAEISHLSTYDFCYTYDIASKSWKNTKDVYPTKTARIKAYTIDKTRTTATANDIQYATIESDTPYTVEYTEQYQYPNFKVTFNNTTLVQNKDYTITYSDNLRIGKAKAILNGIGKYTGTRYITWNIIKPESPPNLPGVLENVWGSSKRVIQVASSIQYYWQIPLPTGWKWVFPEYEVMTGENRNNYVQYYDTENYVRSMYDTIVIKEQSNSVIDILQAQVNFTSNSFVYSGNAITPKVQVVLNGTVLIENSDYIVTYTNNINAGQASLTVQGMGQYTGTITRNFTIEKAASPINTPATTLTIAVNTDLNSALGNDWQLVHTNTTLAVGETKSIQFMHKNAQNYNTGTTITVTITRGNSVSVPTPTPTPQPTPPQPTPSPSDSQTTTTTQNNKILFLILGGSILILTGAIILTVFCIKRKK